MAKTYYLAMLTPAQRRELLKTPATPNRLRAAAKLARLTQNQLADAFGTDQTTVNRLMNGYYKRLPLQTARRYAAFFDCTIDEMFPATDQERVSA